MKKITGVFIGVATGLFVLSAYADNLGLELKVVNLNPATQADVDFLGPLISPPGAFRPVGGSVIYQDVNAMVQDSTTVLQVSSSAANASHQNIAEGEYSGPTLAPVGNKMMLFAVTNVDYVSGEPNVYCAYGVQYTGSSYLFSPAGGFYPPGTHAGKEVCPNPDNPSGSNPGNQSYANKYFAYQSKITDGIQKVTITMCDPGKAPCKAS